MLRPAATGLATAFFRLYLLDALADGNARPPALLAAVSAERLPFASGAFGRALQSLLEGGYVTPATAGEVALTPLGAAERGAERERWRAVLPALRRRLGEPEPDPAEHAAMIAEPPAPFPASAAETYLDRVLLTALRERVAEAREGGAPFLLALARLDVAHPSAAARRAMVQRALRATLGGAAGLLGGDADAYRWGEAGIAVIAPAGADGARAARVAALLELRLEELARTMAGSVRSFSGARWRARAAAALWTVDVATSGELVRAAADALEARVPQADVA